MPFSILASLWFLLVWDTWQLTQYNAMKWAKYQASKTRRWRACGNHWSRNELFIAIKSLWFPKGNSLSAAFAMQMPLPHELLGGLSLHLNHLIASGMEICYRQFGTLPIGIFLSNLDSRQLDTSLMTSYGHFWHMSTFGNSRAVWVLLPKYGALRKSTFSRWRSDWWLTRLGGVLGGQITGLHDGTISLGVRHT